MCFLSGPAERRQCANTLLTSLCTTLGTLNMDITSLLLLNPSENPKLLSTFFSLALRVVSVTL